MARTKRIEGQDIRRRNRGKSRVKHTRLIEVCRVCGIELKKNTPRCYVAGYLLCQKCLNGAIDYLEYQIASKICEYCGKPKDAPNYAYHVCIPKKEAKKNADN